MLAYRLVLFDLEVLDDSEDFSITPLYRSGNLPSCKILWFQVFKFWLMRWGILGGSFERQCS